MDAREIFHIAREAVERFNDHYVKGSLPGFVQHPQKVFASHDRAA